MSFSYNYKGNTNEIIKFIRNTRIEEIKDTSYFINLPIEIIDEIVKKELDLEGLINDRAFLLYNRSIKMGILNEIVEIFNRRFYYEESFFNPYLPYL